MTTRSDLAAIFALVSGGRAHVPLHGSYGKLSFIAQLDASGGISWEDEVFNSPSVAAGRIITRLTGQTTSGRPYVSINGWLAFAAEFKDGRRTGLADLRKELEGGSGGV